MCTELGVKFKWNELRSNHRVFMLKSNTTDTIVCKFLIICDQFLIHCICVCACVLLQALIETIKSETLRNVLREFAQHIFDDGGHNEKSDCCESDSEEKQTNVTFHLCNKKRFPDYNHWYKLVDDKIKKSNSPKPVMFTWLTQKQRDEAITDAKKHLIPDIKKIIEPKDCDYSAMKYPNADRYKFIRVYKNWKPTSSPQSSQSFALAKSFTGSNKKISKISGSKSKSKASYYTCSDVSTSRKYINHS